MIQPEILSGTLKPMHREKGLSLQEDDHFIYLVLDSKFVAVFGLKAPLATILIEADKICFEMEAK